MLNIYVKLQTPVIELPVSAKDAIGQTDSFIAGFKRYEIDEAREKLKALEELQKQVFLNNTKDLKAQYNYLNHESSSTVTEEPTMTEAEANKAILAFIKDEISYLLKVEVITIDSTTKAKTTVKIADTRTAKPIEPLWETPEECLSVLVDSFLACAPFRGSLAAAQQKALLNTDYKDNEIKN